jgi:hypothetical protein
MTSPRWKKNWGHVLSSLLVEICHHFVGNQRLIVRPASRPCVADGVEHKLTGRGDTLDRFISAGAEHLGKGQDRLCSATRRGKWHRTKFVLGIQSIDCLVGSVVGRMAEPKLGRVCGGLRLGKDRVVNRGRIDVCIGGGRCPWRSASPAVMWRPSHWCSPHASLIRRSQIAGLQSGFSLYWLIWQTRTTLPSDGAFAFAGRRP